MYFENSVTALSILDKLPGAWAEGESVILGKFVFQSLKKADSCSGDRSEADIGWLPSYCLTVVLCATTSM